jgi:2-phospho-L-lactate guanylyltransferase
MLAIVPVNDPLRGKQRLSGLFPTDVRAQLVEAMLLDVLDACERASMLKDVLILTPNAAIAPTGCSVMIDPGQGHAHAIDAALRTQDDAAGVLILMADCPLVTGEALDELANAAAPLGIAPAQDGGTNALAMKPGNLLRPAFGVPGSSAVTMATARELGIRPKLVQNLEFAIDLDDSRDIERIMGNGATTRTAALLASSGFALEPTP